MAGHVELGKPEPHDLHQALGIRPRDGIALEAALDVDDRQDHFGRQADSAGLAVDGGENFDALGGIGHLDGEPARHVGEPDLRLEAIVESQWFLQGSLEFFTQQRIAVRGARGADQRRQRHAGGYNQQGRQQRVFALNPGAADRALPE